MTFQEINNLRKQGKLEEAYRLAREVLQNAPEDLWLNRAMGWVLYDLIKRELRTVSESEGEAETTGEESSVDLQRVQRYFAEFRKLQLPLDETRIRSQMLRLAAKAQKAGWQGFLEFVEWWGLEHLSEEDWQPHRMQDGRELPSIALSTLYALGRALKTLSPQDSRVAWILNWLQEGLRRHPDNQWLQRSRGIALRHLGRIDEAHEAMIQVLRVNPREWWRWKDKPRCLNQAIRIWRLCAIIARARWSATKAVGRVYQRLAQLLADNHATQKRLGALESPVIHGNTGAGKSHKNCKNCWMQNGSQITKMRPSQKSPRKGLQGYLCWVFLKPVQLKRAILDHHNTEKEIAYFLWSPREGRPIRYRDFPKIRTHRLPRWQR
jgi:tetratricopeptide (TPR) repeat protein